MKQVDFYLIENQVANARFKLASRLAKKLQSLQQKALIVVDDEDQLHQLDQTLWTFSDTSFVAHDRINPNSEPPLSKTHIGIKNGFNHREDTLGYDVLISLTQEILETSDAFSRVAEIIEADDASKAAGRERFKGYRERGFELKTHKLEL